MPYDDRIHCDSCGRYMNPQSPGSSWVFVPDSDVSYEENVNRCATCTQKYGRPVPHQGVRLDVCSGIVEVKP